MLVSAIQSRNAAVPMEVSPAGSVNSFSALQFCKKPYSSYGSDFIFLESVRFVRAIQETKQPPPISVTLSGIDTVVSALHSKNAWVPTLVTPSGKCISFKA